MSSTSFIKITDVSVNADPSKYTCIINENYELIVSSSVVMDDNVKCLILAVPYGNSTFSVRDGSSFISYPALDVNYDFIDVNIEKIFNKQYLAAGTSGSYTPSMVQQQFAKFIIDQEVYIKKDSKLNHTIKIANGQDNKKYKICIWLKSNDLLVDELIDLGYIICPPFAPRTQTTESQGFQITGITFFKDVDDKSWMRLSIIDNKLEFNNYSDPQYSDNNRRTLTYYFVSPGGRSDIPQDSHTFVYNTNTFNLDIPYNIPYIIEYKYISAFKVDDDSINSFPLKFSTKSILDTFNTTASVTLDNVNSDNFIVGDDIAIPSSEHNRFRCVVDIAEISAISDVYYTSGEFVSKFYTTNDAIYVFSLKVDEHLPNIPGLLQNVDKYKTCKYFVQFSNNEWIQISPINRTDEFDDANVIVPKYIVLDNALSNSSTNTKYLNYNNSCYSFRLKIVMKVDIVGDNYYTPIINSYQCMVSDKNKILKV